LFETVILAAAMLLLVHISLTMSFIRIS